MEIASAGDKGFMESETWGLLSLVFFTSTLSGVLGMAGGMVLMGGLLLFYGPVEAIFLHGIIQAFANFQRYYQLRKHTYLKVFYFYSIGALVSYGLLRQVSYQPSATAIYTVMAVGAFIGSMQFKVPYSVRDPRISFFAGFVTNSMQIIGGVAGPILEFFFQDKRLSRHAIVGTKAITVVTSHLLKVCFMTEVLGTKAARALLTWDVALLLVASYLGTLLSKIILDRLSDRYFFRLTSLCLLSLGLFYLWKALRPLA